MTWPEQFARSLSSSDSWPATSLDEYVATFLLDDCGDTADEVSDLAIAAMRGVAQQALIDAYNDLEQAWLRHESPIEEALFFAFVVLGREIFDTVAFRFGPHVAGRNLAAPDVLFIESQAQIGEYRADFLLTARSRWGFGDQYVDATLVVECDGHDFHDRTKEQASRDRARDRTLQAAGYPVYRFTGSDIWKDVAQCAREALEAVYETARQRQLDA